MIKSCFLAETKIGIRHSMPPTIQKEYENETI